MVFIKITKIYYVLGTCLVSGTMSFNSDSKPYKVYAIVFPVPMIQSRLSKVE